MNHPHANVDRAELAKFEALAARWWDPSGEFRTLHDINPVRLEYVATHAAPLAGKRVLDVGCGGGIFSEALARRGAHVTGLDLAEGPLRVAQLHLRESGLDVEYLLTDVEKLAAERPATYDVVTCLEMLEHVPDPASVVHACAALVKPGGHVFFSTLNRTLKAWLAAIVGAEYLLRLLPRGTHDYERFIRPSELGRWLRTVGLELRDLTGLRYDPFLRRGELTDDVAVNYLVHAVREKSRT